MPEPAHEEHDHGHGHDNDHGAEPAAKPRAHHGHSHHGHAHHGHAHHGHAHGHSHGEPGSRKGRAFAIGIGLNLAFVVVEVGSGLFAHSLALLADAGHNFGDVLGLGLAWGAAALAQRKPSARRTYGLRE
jgi:cobalt-zinc-cadmium efflux system protein